MATVNKQSIEVAVTTLGGNKFEAKDTDSVKAGALAFTLFMRHETVEIKGENETTYVPFHAIDNVVVKRTNSETEVVDDNCVVDDGETPEPVEP